MVPHSNYSSSIILWTVLFLAVSLPIGCYMSFEEDDSDEDSMFSGGKLESEPEKSASSISRRNSEVRYEPLGVRGTPTRSSSIPNGILICVAILLVSTLLVGAFLFYFVCIKEDEEVDEILDQLPVTDQPIDFWSQEGASLQQKQPTVEQFEVETSVDFGTSRSSSRSTLSDHDGKINSN
uniref:Uncharacterized protein n=1 Tax=Romanomermis culicivorax TaxID=13658 RepID=A0A915JDZ8_ROMCU